MKRSEMLQIIMDVFKKPDLLVAQAILIAIEDKGMLPPTLKKYSYADMKNKNKWEDE